MKEFHPRTSKKKRIIQLILVSLFYLFFCNLTTNGFTSFSIIDFLIIGLGILIFVFWFLSIYKNKPTLVIDNEGIIDNGSMNNCGKILWKNIRNIEIRKGVNMSFLCIDLVNEDLILNNVNPLKRQLILSNKKKLKTICCIPEISLNENLEKIIEDIEKNCIQQRTVDKNN